MWQYLVFNSLCFLVLFLARFSRQSFLKSFVFMLIIATAVVTAWRSPIDPFSWFYYLIFSLVVFYGAERFRRWVHAKSLAQQEELRAGAKKLESEGRWLAEESQAADALGDRANQIALLYDRIKEMSQSLEPFETFLVFGETLLKFCRFGSIRLALFNEEQPNPRVPDELFELRYADLESLVDRSALLKEKHPARTQVFPFDQRLFEWIFKNQIALKCLDPRNLVVDETFELPADVAPLMAYPIFIHKKIYAVLTLLHVDREDISMLNILIERFLSELQRVRLYQKVEMLAITDGLTGLYVRRHLLERLEGEILRCKKFDIKLSFLMIDVDHFKNFNDQYGHLVGDVVLKQAADTITKNIRELDLAGRYGGEEFGVILVDTDEAGAFFVAERICRAVAEKVTRAYDENLKVTISIGCATYSHKLNQTYLLVDAADSALYQAKQQGRNRVCAANLADS